MASNKRTIYLGLNYSNFTGGVTEVNRKMGLLDAEFKRATQEAKNYGTETDQLALKQDYLTQKIALQNQKVEEAKKAYDAAMSSQNASQKEIDELDKRLLNERTKLEQLNGELIRTQRETSGLDEANKKLDDTLKGLALGIAAVVGALFKFAIDAGKTADELNTLSVQTGMTTTEIQRLQYAAKFVDVEFDTMASAINKVKDNMGKARDGSKDLTDAFGKLHVRIKDSSGQLRDSKEVFYDIIDALKNVKNETERDILAKELLGKSYTDLKPLVEAGTKALEEYGDEAERNNKIMSPEEIAKNQKFNDSWERIAATFDRVKVLLGEALMPLLENLMGFMEKVNPKTLLIIAAVGGIIKLVFTAITAITALSTAMSAQTGVQMVFNAVSLKSILIIAAVAAGILLLVLAIKELTGGTEKVKEDMAQVEKYTKDINKNLNSSVNSANTIGRNASGTNFWRGGRTLVGEEGPEIVDLPRGSRIYNAKDSAQMAGSTTNYYNITIDAKNVQDFNRVVELAQQQRMGLRRT